MTTTTKFRGAALGAAALALFAASPASAQSATPLWVGWDLSLEGGLSFLSHGSKNVWAQDTTISAAGVSANNRTVTPDIGMTGKISANLRWGTWDVGASYRGTLAFEQKERSEIRVGSPLSFTFPVGTSPLFSLLPIPLPALGAEAETKQNSNQHAFDFVVGYNKSFGWGEARVFGGLRFAMLNVDTETTFNTLDLATFRTDRDSSYWGIGPTIGTQFKYLLGRRWVVGAMVQGAILFGDRKTKENTTLSVPASRVSGA